MAAQIVTVPDVVEEIGATAVSLSTAYKTVISCGGVGPTLDDVTMDGMAHGFNVPLRPFAPPPRPAMIILHEGPGIIYAFVWPGSMTA